ncbi:MAG: hypothetical protein A4E57_03525 [Syntrophorhabdaceae bacterium PtaU1.Bin034]|jgi:hypothetical protein|nr:MAG: hypothetical protein A4E57_03525 [Syntrophorhabdaceae bacterium PtaU1.Bin034]
MKMNRQFWSVICFVCVIALIITGCSLGKSAKKTTEQGRQTEQMKQEEAARLAELAKEEEREKKWEEYATDGARVVYYLDKEGMTFPSKNMVQVWRKRVFPQRSPQKEIISLDVIDCVKQKYRSLIVQGVQWDGSSETWRKPSPWTTIHGDTAEEYILDHFCKEAESPEKTEKATKP